MTMPHERLRALRWGYELLQEMGQDPSLPGDLRERAGVLLVVYPAPEMLAQHVVDGLGGLPKAWADAMTEAKDLFEAVEFSGKGSVQTQRSLLFTRRHYPERSLIELMVRSRFLEDWLAAADPFGR